ncbi:hypothetical protein CAP36_15320 [Chitinophagaceae bacterium IBVUCB2]|nr:hypothetical protein CAP36_15320 [Chitinophagaceae bacterium IBVUCB2]
MQKIIFFLGLLLLIALHSFSQQNEWTWMKGDNSPTFADSAAAVYGPLGIPGSGFRPGGRPNATMWSDASGNVWLFGGSGTIDGSSYGNLNDLWKYNPSTNEWTWVKGDNLLNVSGIYNNSNLLLNKPGARYGAVGWVDAAGNFWLFGGYGIGSTTTEGRLNDLWRYTISTNTWTFIKGDVIPEAIGVYTNANLLLVKPGGRIGATGWREGGSLWLFGGTGKASTTINGSLNDLWRYTIATNTWTFIKGNNTVETAGVYTGTASSLKPGSRSGATSWVDASGKAWLFGGSGNAATIANGNLNDLWSFDPITSNWTWVKGDNTRNRIGIYGTITQPDLTNKPGSRSYAVGWADSAGDLWLFGGSGLGNNFGESGWLNDLWKYNKATNTWTWMNGFNTADDYGVYGTQGIAGNNVTPGSKYSAVACKDASGNFWLYGGIGYGYAPGSTFVYLNELWKFNPVANEWTWARHNNLQEAFYTSRYGIQGITDILNKPGGRSGASNWTDLNGSFWLFGGYGRGSRNYGNLNDLWKYAPATNNWVWMKGDSTIAQLGIYGQIGQPATSNKPGSRNNAHTWKDNNGDLWLFGGFGFGNSAEGVLSDLWKYSISNNMWTWMKGDSSVYNAGIYNQSAAQNKPGGRNGGVTWTDATGNFWLFGGYGYGSSPVTDGRLNDLWKYTPGSNEWVFIKGNDIPNLPGNYGTQGLSNLTNNPGSRNGGVAWVDGNGAFWLFGGEGYSSSNYGELNDLWKYNPTNNEWVWIKGNNIANIEGSYGTISIPSINNKPGARAGSSSWVDASNNLWLQGGFGKASSNFSSSGQLDDLWKYNIQNNVWTWIKGNDSPGNNGEYGSQGTSNPANRPGGRHYSASWKNTGTQLWLFGGYGYGSSSPETQLNDLWKYELPCSGEIILSPISGIICFDGNPVTLTASGGAAPYTWYKDGVIIPGQSGPTYTPTTIGSYYVKGNVGTCTDVYSNEVLFQSPSVEPSLGGNGVYCEGANVNVGIPDTEEDQDYTWVGPASYYVPIGGGGGNQSLNFAMEASYSGTYIVRSTKPGCDTVYSNNVSVYYGGVTELVTTSVCSNQVSFSWRDYGSPVKRFQYAVTLFSSPPASGTTETSTFGSVGGLLSSTTYYIHVRGATIPGFDINSISFCNDWTTISFTTPATPSIPTLSPVSATVCPGSSQLLTATGGNTYEWTRDNIVINGVTSPTYNATIAGTYQVNAFINGCTQTSLQSNTSIITITPVATSITNISVCNNQLPFNWNGNNYNTAGTYNLTLTTQAGCDSIATLNLTIKPTSTSITNTAVCSNLLPFNWNGNNYSTAGTYNVTLVAANGCDSIATLNLSVNAASTSITNISICNNQLPYTWNGNNYTTGGTYNVTLTGTNGCDSIATLNLSVSAVLTSTTNASVCINQLPYVWNGNNYNTAGLFNITLVSQSGCDSIATLNLTINPLLTSTTNAAVCSNQLPYSWNGNNYNSGGTYNIILSGSNGCDSTATLNLTVNQTSSSTTNVAVCSNLLPYSWNGNSYTVGGTYNVTLIGANGCDSVATLNLSVNTALTSTTTASICTNQLPYSWNGNSYNAAGIYNVTLVAANGCDSIATLNLAVSTVLTSTTNASVCANQLPFIWNGNNYSTAGTFNITFVSQSGCDSIATLNLIIKPVLTSTTNASVCSNQLPFNWNGNNYTASGIYNITLPGSNGCDSIATLNLTINPISTSITNASVCSNQLPYSWNGTNYTSTGTYNITLQSTSGCDSIATLNLIVKPVQTSTTNVSICSNQLPYNWNGNNYNLAGTYNVTLAGSNGCDSLATLNLSIGAVLTSTTNINVCANQLPYSWNGNSYNAAGTFNVTLISQAGCDSIATLNLGVTPVLTSVTNINRCANQLPYNWNGNNYTATGIYNITLAGSNGCDSIASLNLTVNPVLTSTTAASICSNQAPYSWNGNNYTASGIYTVTLTGSNGCDSIATLNLEIKPIRTSNSNIEVCTNQLPYSWNGNNYSSAGSYNVTLTGSNSCDSIATLNLTIKSVSASTTNISICANQLPFSWNGNSYSASGSYNVVLTGANGCDSTATLILVANSLPVGSISPGNTTICAGASQVLTISGGVSYQWFLNGNPVNGAIADVLTVTTQGAYSVQITAANGCKAMASNTVNIIVIQKPTAAFSYSALCQNETTIFTNTSTTGSSGTVNWNWSFGDNTTSFVFAPTHVYTQPGSFTAALIATPAACPQLADTIKKVITVIAAIPGVRYDNVRVLKNTAYPLSSRSIGVQYVWLPGTSLNNSTIQNPIVTTAADRQYLVRIKTAAGCLVTDTLLVQAFDKADVFVPKAFTPNNNNANDKLRPLGVSIATIDYFRVYNRWGQLMYQTQNSGEGWDGNYKNIPQPTETYTWVFAGKSQDGTLIKASGKTVLIR